MLPPADATRGVKRAKAAATASGTATTTETPASLSSSPRASAARATNAAASVASSGGDGRDPGNDVAAADNGDDGGVAKGKSPVGSPSRNKEGQRKEKAVSRTDPAPEKEVIEAAEVVGATIVRRIQAGASAGAGAAPVESKKRPRDDDDAVDSVVDGADHHSAEIRRGHRQGEIFLGKEMSNGVRAHADKARSGSGSNGDGGAIGRGIEVDITAVHEGRGEDGMATGHDDHEGHPAKRRKPAAANPAAAAAGPKAADAPTSEFMLSFVCMAGAPCRS